MVNSDYADTYHIENGVGHLTLNNTPPYTSESHMPCTIKVSVNDLKFAERLRPENSIVANLLPPGTIYTQRSDSSSQLLVVQEPPMQRMLTVRFSGNPTCTCEIDEETGDPLEDCDYCTGEYDDYIEAHEGESQGWQVYNITTPWIIYILVHSSEFGNKPINSIFLTSIFASSSEITDINQPVSTLPLPNVYRQGGICHGDIGSFRQQYQDKSTSTLVSEAVNGFWNSTFNMDVTTCMETNIYKKLHAEHGVDTEAIYQFMTRGRYFELWESLSEKEVLELPWANNWDRALSFYLVNRATEFTMFRSSLRSATTYSRVYT